MKRFFHSLTVLSLLALVTACGSAEETAPVPDAPPSSAPVSSAVTTSAASPSASASSSASASPSASPTPTPSLTVKKPTVTETNIPASPAPTKPGQTRPTNAPNGTNTSGERAAGIPAGARELSTQEYGGIKVATALSPTGNIACEFYDDRAQCGVLSLGEAALQKITNSNTVRVNGWSYAVDSAGKVYDTGSSQAPVATLSQYRGQTIPYGTTVYYGQFTLHSEENGMTLTDTESGHGAHYSREGIRTF